MSLSAKHTVSAKCLGHFTCFYRQKGQLTPWKADHIVCVQTPANLNLNVVSYLGGAELYCYLTRLQRVDNIIGERKLLSTLSKYYH